jgi:hypothetical protein
MREVEKTTDLEEIKKLGRIDLSTEAAYQESKQTVDGAESPDRKAESPEGQARPENGETKNG